MMNNRLTNDAKAVLQYAQEAAQKFHHDYVGTEHILLGLVLNTDGIAGLLLNQLGLTPENVTRAIEQHVGWGQDSPTKLRLTPRTKRAMELAVREANRLEQNYVGTEHMLAGILEEGSGMAVQILEDMDIDPDLVSQRLSELMNDPAVEGGDAVPSKNGSDLSQFGRDLNEWAKQGKIDRSSAGKRKSAASSRSSAAGPRTIRSSSAPLASARRPSPKAGPAHHHWQCARQPAGQAHFLPRFGQYRRRYQVPW